jgi:hypothetical protein
MSAEEKRAVLEAAGWVLYLPGELAALRPLYTLENYRIVYHFMPPDTLGKTWRDITRSYSCSADKACCIENAYDKFLRGIE